MANVSSVSLSSLYDVYATVKKSANQTETGKLLKSGQKYLKQDFLAYCKDHNGWNRRFLAERQFPRMAMAKMDEWSNRMKINSNVEILVEFGSILDCTAIQYDNIQTVSPECPDYELIHIARRAKQVFRDAVVAAVQRDGLDSVLKTLDKEIQAKPKLAEKIKYWCCSNHSVRPRYASNLDEGKEITS